MVEPLQLLRIDPSRRTAEPAVPAAAPPSREHLLLVQRTGADVDWSFVGAAAALVRSDPRMASVSQADSAVRLLAEERGRGRLSEPLPLPPAWALGAAPAGAAVVLAPLVQELVGHPLPQEAADIGRWAAAASARGLRHAWWVSGGPGPQHPWLTPASADIADARDPAAALGSLVDAYRGAYCPITVAVDAEWLGPHETGAQVAVTHWLTALADRADIAELALLHLPGDALPGYAQHLADHPKVTVVRRRDPDRVRDVFWRPNQPNAAAAAFVDRPRGRRLVVTVYDLISFANRRYHPDASTWQSTRSVLRRYLLEADLVAGISRDVIDLLPREVPGLDPARLRLTTLGVEHLRPATAGRPPADLLDAWPGAGASRFLLVLGNDYLHKNRDLAIKVWRAVAESHAVDLVLAGLHVGARSSQQQEDALMTMPSPGGGSVIRLSHVSSPAKEWLLGNAAVVLYPTSAEGFGFIPHEAAQVGVPSLSTAFGPLGEFLPPEGLTEDWSVSQYAARLRALLDDPEEARRQLAAVRAMDAALTWQSGGALLARAFRDALAMPVRTAGPSGMANEAAVLRFIRAGGRARAVRERLARRRGPA